MHEIDTNTLMTAIIALDNQLLTLLHWHAGKTPQQGTARSGMETAQDNEVGALLKEFTRAAIALRATWQRAVAIDPTLPEYESFASMTVLTLPRPGNTKAH